MDCCRKFLFTIFFFVMAGSIFGQKGVGINTSEISPGSALQVDSSTGSLVIPRMNQEQMLAIQDVLDGAIVFNTTDQNWYIRIDGLWAPYVYNETPSIILNKEGGSLVQTTTPLHIPLNDNNVVSTSNDYYRLVGSPTEDATIRVLNEGLYLVTAGMSTTQLPAEPKKYKILLYVNGNLASYLTSGYVKLDRGDYWGTSGNSPVLLRANDVVEIKYILDGSGTIPGKFFNIGISKL